MSQSTAGCLQTHQWPKSLQPHHTHTVRGLSWLMDLGRPLLSCSAGFVFVFFLFVFFIATWIGKVDSVWRPCAVWPHFDDELWRFSFTLRSHNRGVKDLIQGQFDILRCDVNLAAAYSKYSPWYKPLWESVEARPCWTIRYDDNGMNKQKCFFFCLAAQRQITLILFNYPFMNNKYSKWKKCS